MPASNAVPPMELLGGIMRRARLILLGQQESNRKRKAPSEMPAVRDRNAPLPPEQEVFAIQLGVATVSLPALVTEELISSSTAVSVVTIQRLFGRHCLRTQVMRS